MTTITFEEDIKINKLKFKNIADFKEYLDDSFCVAEFRQLNKTEITSEMIEKMEETKRLNNSNFVSV